MNSWPTFRYILSILWFGKVSMVIKLRIYSFSIAVLFMFILLFCHSSKQPDIKNYEQNELENWGIEKMNIPKLWVEGFKGRGINIAIMDSGVNYNHPDFSNNIHTGFNAIEPQKLPIDDYGHGTLVTGIIAAQHDNNIGFKGIAPEANIYPVKVLDRFGKGSLVNIERGIDWCIEHNIDIINMSFSMPNDNVSLHRSIQKATSKGIIIVASATNSYGGDVGYPASYDEVISVTSIDSKLRAGETAPVGNIDFSAPGVNIISTSMDGKYQYESGTSIAAPFVTGLIALLLEEDFSTSEQIFNSLKYHIVDLGKRGKDSIYGWGLLKISDDGG
jgi:subtilisin family serine protease